MTRRVGEGAGVLRRAAPWLLAAVACALTLVRFDANAQERSGSGAQPPPAITKALEVCEACHGPHGASTQPQYPILAGQQMYYTYLQLQDFQSGRRKNPQMAGLLDRFSKDELRSLATYFAAQTWPTHDFTATAQQIKEAKAAINSAECTQCHLGEFLGDSRVPRLAGQYPQYLESTMLDFKHKRRTNAPQMASLMETYSQEDIAAMAAYLAQLHPQPGG